MDIHGYFMWLFFKDSFKITLQKLLKGLRALTIPTFRPEYFQPTYFSFFSYTFWLSTMSQSDFLDTESVLTSVTTATEADPGILSLSLNPRQLPEHPSPN